jgi:hypothetical protein
VQAPLEAISGEPWEGRDMDFLAIFSVGNLVALTGWAAMLVGLFVKPVRNPAFLYSGLILPALLAIAYLALLAMQMTGGSGEKMDFTTLEGVKGLLGSDAGATIGWYHYLAFDMIIGTWVARDGLARGVWPIALVPVLALVFMFGPVGFLVYLIVWALFLRKGPGTLPYPAADVP